MMIYERPLRQKSFPRIKRKIVDMNIDNNEFVSELLSKPKKVKEVPYVPIADMEYYKSQSLLNESRKLFETNSVIENTKILMATEYSGHIKTMRQKIMLFKAFKEWRNQQYRITYANPDLVTVLKNRLSNALALHDQNVRASLIVNTQLEILDGYTKPSVEEETAMDMLSNFNI